MGRGEKIARNLRDIASAARSGPVERKRVARRYVHDALRRAVPYTGVETHGLIVFSATKDRNISRKLFTDGWWDWDGLPAALRSSGVDLVGATMVEVGANIGTTTLQAAQMGARVLAFEPEPSNFRMLRANIAANLYDDQVTCVRAGCSAENRSARMELSVVNAGEHRISDQGDVAVELVRLDDALAAQGVAPTDVRLLWIDTEGHEVDVLLGAPDLLATRPVTLMEFWPKMIGSRLDVLAELITGYSGVIDMATGRTTSVAEAARAHEHDLTDLLLMP